MGCAIGTSGAMVPSARDSIRDKDAGYGILRTIYRFEDVLPKLVILITLITPIHKLLPAKLDLPSIHPTDPPPLPRNKPNACAGNLHTPSTVPMTVFDCVSMANTVIS